MVDRFFKLLRLDKKNLDQSKLADLVYLLERREGDELKEIQQELAHLVRQSPKVLIDELEKLGRSDTTTRIRIGEVLALIGKTAWDELLKAASRNYQEDFGWSTAWAIKHFVGICSIDQFIAALKHPNVHVRWGTALHLGDFHDVRAIAPLIEMFNEAGMRDYHYKVRGCAAHGLRKLGEIAFPAIFEAMKSPNPQVREAATHALMDTRHPLAIEPVVKALKDSDWRVRRNAVRVMVTLAETARDEGKDILPDLIHLVREGDHPSLGYIIKPIAYSGVQALPILVEISGNQALDTVNVHARSYALLAIAEILKQHALHPYELTDLFGRLLDIKHEPENFFVRKHASTILALIGGNEAPEYLIGALGEPHPFVLLETIKGIRKLKATKALDTLKQLAVEWEGRDYYDDLTAVGDDDLKYEIGETIKELEAELKQDDPNTTQSTSEL